MTRLIAGLFVALALVTACGGDDDDNGGGTEADRIGVGAQCESNDDCLQTGDGGIVQECLQQFKGGYCGLVGCDHDVDCPYGSACVLHDDGETYCFRVCREKYECNANRAPDAESNCSSKIEFLDDQASGVKACVPPSGG